MLMRYLAAFVVAMVASLSGCGSQPPTLSQRDISRIHTVKVVYVQPRHELGMISVASQGGFMPLATGGILYLPDKPEVDLTDKYLSQYQSEIDTLDTRKRLLAIATQAAAEAPWLAKAPFEVADKPIQMWQYTQDSGLDAVVFLVPTTALSEFGFDLLLNIHVLIYVNPHNAASYVRDSAVFGDNQRLLIPGENAHESALDMHGMHVKDAVSIWFGDDAGQLHKDIDSALPLISAGLTHYLAGDASSEGK